jgi:hypothetical protein
MSNKLIGTDPNQVPSNADLGTLAYQDAYNPSVEKLRIYSPQNTENSLEFKSSHALSKTYKIYNAVGWNPDALLIYNHTDDSTVLTIEPGKLGINRGANSLTRTLEVNGSAWISGALGIGTETSTSVLTVNSNISSSSATVIDIHQATNGANKQVAGIGVLIDNGGESTNAGGMFFQTASGGSLTERLRLTSGGSLELGYGGAARQQADSQAFTITTPANGGGQGIALKRLDSNSDQNLGEISWSNNTQDGQAKLKVKTTGAVNTTDMGFSVNNAGTLVQAMVIKGGSTKGNVRIGQDTVNWPGNGNTTTGVTIGGEGRITASYNGDHVWNRNSDGILMSWRRSGGEYGSVSVSTSGTTYNTSSDIRLKTDINPIEDSVEKVRAMNPVLHKWKNNISADAVHGFIAQEMQEVIPEAVTGDPNSEDMMSMDYGRITPVIVAALQNALKEIDELKTRIDDLENK